MTEAEFLERIDRHLERADRHMERGNEIMTRSNEIMTRNDETMKRSNEVIADHREFMRELTVRNERVTQQLVDQISANTERIGAEMRANTAVLDDISLATRQHTQALARILDRLD